MDDNPLDNSFEWLEEADNGGNGDGGLGEFGNALLTNAGYDIGIAGLSGLAKASALVSQLDTALALAEAAGNGEAVDKILDILKALATADPDPSQAQAILDHLQEVLTNHGINVPIPLIDPNASVPDQLKHIINQLTPVPVIPETPATPPTTPH
jgi:hypothetical protein